jgi:DNA-directed RNA polymerase subunit RPC12/RpoP
MAKTKHTKVKCSNCKKDAKIYTASLDESGETAWECPHCHTPNVHKA